MHGRAEAPGAAGRLQGQVAVVTGAGSGVGRAAAEHLAREGAATVLVGRRTEPLEETRGLLGNAGEAMVHAADVGDASAVEALAAAVRERFGGVDILINAAGINVPRRALALVSTEDFDGVVAANLQGPFYCVRALLPLMRERGGGTVVNIASDVSLRANVKAGVSYVASKFGLNGLTQAINAEERANGIRACIICPGDITTPLLDRRPVPPGPRRGL